MPTIVQVYLGSRLVVRTFDPHIYLCLISPSGLVDAATGEIFDTAGSGDLGAPQPNCPVSSQSQG